MARRAACDSASRVCNENSIVPIAADDGMVRLLEPPLVLPKKPRVGRRMEFVNIDGSCGVSVVPSNMHTSDGKAEAGGVGNSDGFSMGREVVISRLLLFPFPRRRRF